MSKSPAGISFGQVYIAPLLVDVLLGLAVAFVIESILNMTELSPLFVHPPLAFVSFRVLATAAIGLRKPIVGRAQAKMRLYRRCRHRLFPDCVSFLTRIALQTRNRGRKIRTRSDRKASHS